MSIPYFPQVDINKQLTTEDLAALAYAVEGINKQFSVNQNVSVSGTTAATTTSYLSVGTNVITSATTTDYAIRLPYPPKKGTTVTIVNTSAVPIAVYPSITGGSINNVVNGSALVPNDGKSYIFTCWENPLPGAWSWTPPAINQYDSGEIIFSNLTSPKRFAAISTAFVTEDPNNQPTSNSWAFDGRNIPITTAGVSPNSIPFSKIITSGSAVRIKIYSNFITTYGGAGFNVAVGGTYQFVQSSIINYYEKSTGIYSNTYSGASSAGVFASINDVVSQGVISGTPTGGINTCSLNIGDAGTPFQILELSSTFFQGTKLGDSYLGDITIDGVVYEQWFTRVISFKINTTNFAPVGAQNLKLRFFIEYN